MILILILALLVIELAYFKIADKFRIIDEPTNRSSHNYVTRRGGGIIFPIAWILFSIYNGGMLPWFTFGLILISFVSFWDDKKEVSVFLRLSVHSIAIACAFYDLGLLTVLPVWATVLAFIFSLSAINAINFMDGINGITGMYALVFWSTIAFSGIHLFDGDFMKLSLPLSFMICALLVFGYFNFRKTALTFAGDIGSVSMAYLMIGYTLFFIFHPAGSLILDVKEQSVSDIPLTFNFKFLLLLAVYGVDSFLTILHRLFLGENILKGHRKHLYQYLVNEFKIPHLIVAISYSVVQLIISLWVLNSEVLLWQALSVIFVLSVIYLVTKAYIFKNISGQHLSIEKNQPLDTLSHEMPHFQRTKKIS